MVDTILHCACTREQFILTLIIYCFFVEKYLLFLRRKTSRSRWEIFCNDKLKTKVSVLPHSNISN